MLITDCKLVTPDRLCRQQLQGGQGIGALPLNSIILDLLVKDLAVSYLDKQKQKGKGNGG